LTLRQRKRAFQLSKKRRTKVSAPVVPQLGEGLREDVRSVPQLASGAQILPYSVTIEDEMAVTSTRGRKAALGIIIAASLALGSFLFLRGREEPEHFLTLYGNVDIREVQVAFNDSDRIARMFVQEGDFVRRGELLAELDARRYSAKTAQAKADVVQARANVAKANEDIASATANRINAIRISERDARLLKKGTVSVEQAQTDESTLRVATANLAVAQSQLALAEAALKSKEAALAFAERELADTKLYAHSDGVIEDRILEPGDMASQSTPVFTLALTDPLWVRAYVPEIYLGRIYPGMKASIASDSYPGKAFAGWVGYISPTAEFTPKSVETPELRTRLVYEVRVYACNPQNELRLGMPATVTVPLNQSVPDASQVTGLGCGERE
jgi:HlyD family secretion protein